MADAEEQEVKQKSGKLRWVLLALLGVAVLVGGAYATVTFVLPLEEGDQPEPQEPPPVTEQRPMQFALPEIIVNLDEGRLERMLKVHIVLELWVADEYENETLRSTLHERTSEIKDCLITLFAGKDMDALRGGAEAKARIKKEVKGALNELLFSDNPDKIRRLFFQQFLVQ